MEDQRRPIYAIAQDIKQAWGNKVSIDALPYLNAMTSLTDRTSNYGADDAVGIVLYFLSNAGGFRGEEARRLKAELKAHIQ